MTISKETEYKIWICACAFFCIISIGFMAWCFFDTARNTYTPDPVMTTQQYSNSVLEERMAYDGRE